MTSGGTSVTTSPVRGPQGIQGEPGLSNATSLRNIPLSDSVSTPPRGCILGFNADTGKWDTYMPDAGTF